MFNITTFLSPFRCIEILTRLEDEVISDEKWELKIFQVWTVPVEGRVKYNILLFQKVHKYFYKIILNVILKGGIVYRASLVCVLSKCGDSHILYLNQDHLNMLKLVTLKKLKEEFPDLNIKMELPGGLDVNRVTTPVLLTAPSSSDPAPTSPAPPNKTKSKTGGILGLFKSSSPTPDPPQPQNNLTGKTKIIFKAECFL